jgi:hypothetical protein
MTSRFAFYLFCLWRKICSGEVSFVTLDFKTSERKEIRKKETGRKRKRKEVGRKMGIKETVKRKKVWEKKK